MAGAGHPLSGTSQSWNEKVPALAVVNLNATNGGGGGTGAVIDDGSISTTTAYSSSKIEGTFPKIDDGASSGNTTYSGTKIDADIASAAGVQIDDATPSLTTAYSGTKIEGTFTKIDDGAASGTTTYSGTKIDADIASAAGVQIDDATPSLTTAYSGTKIEGTFTKIDDGAASGTTTYSGTKIDADIASAAGAQIDDATPSLTTAYSSTKIEGTFPKIDDGAASATTTYSGTKIDADIASAAGAQIDDGSISMTTAYSSTKIEGTFPKIDDALASATNTYSSTKIETLVSAPPAVTGPILEVNTAGAVSTQSGIRSVNPTGAAPNQMMVYEAARDAWTAGAEGTEQVVAVRVDAPVSARSLVWDAAGKQLASEPAHATTLFVSSTGSMANDGLTPSSAFLTIAQATAVATSGDSIILSADVFTESVTLPAGVFLRGEGATIAGTGGSALDLNADCCVTIACITVSSGRAIRVSGGGSARIFINRIMCSGTAAAFRCQSGEIDIVVGTIRVMDGNIVDEFTSDRVNITATQLVATGSGNIFRFIAGATITVMCSHIVCGAGTVFDTQNNPAVAEVDVSCARLDAVNLSDIDSSSSVKLIASRAAGTLVESGSGTVSRLSPP